MAELGRICRTDQSHSCGEAGGVGNGNGREDWETQAHVDPPPRGRGQKLHGADEERPEGQIENQVRRDGCTLTPDPAGDETDDGNRDR